MKTILGKLRYDWAPVQLVILPNVKKEKVSTHTLW
jgi:hypothetical protein